LFGVGPGIDPRAAFRVGAGVSAQPVGEGLFVVDLGAGTTYKLNLTGRRMWEALAAGLPLGAMATEVSARHGIPARVATADAEALVAHLESHGLLVRAGR
jgi:hypothetical protein